MFVIGLIMGIITVGILALHSAMCFSDLVRYGLLCTESTRAKVVRVLSINRQYDRCRFVVSENDCTQVLVLKDIKLTPSDVGCELEMVVTTHYWIVPKWIPNWFLEFGALRRENPFHVSAEITVPKERLDEIIQQL